MKTNSLLKNIQRNNIRNLLILICFIFVVSCSKDKESKQEKAKMDYTLPAEAYKTRMEASDPADWRPAKLKVTTPTEGITLSENGLFKPALERNINYLMTSFTVNHLMYPFWVRAGKEVRPDDRPQVGFWDTDLRGSSAGRFLMGAGNTLRWIENQELRKRLDEIIDIIEDCREPNGYILPYPPIPDSIRSEEPNYARAWLTHGLIDAAIAGNPKAYGLLRGHADWFNTWDIMHPKLLYWVHNSHQGHIASTRTYLSPVGKPEDLQTAEKYYVCDWWIDELAARHEEAIWQYPLQNPHSYLIASFEAYLDHYIATGDKNFLDAMLGAWEMIHESWEHVGGSIAICENQWDTTGGTRVLKHWDKTHECSHPPHSYYLTDTGHTGETCGSVFWVKFNQRLHNLFPDEEKYINEIEKSIYNVSLANQKEDGLICYHAHMQGKKETPTQAINSCCEGQGTRLLASLPEYIYSIASDGLYVNLYEPSSIDWNVNEQAVNLAIESQFPFKPEVALKVSSTAPVKMKLRVRIPSWADKNVAISVNGKQIASGQPGSYAELSRKWENGDKVEFALPMSLRFTPYTGMEEMFPRERVAVEYGPILLACVRKTGVSALNGLTDLEKRLIPDASKPLHFLVKDDTVRYYKPYWLIDDEEFAVYEPTVFLQEIELSEHLVSKSFSVEFFNNIKWEGKPAYSGTTKNLYFAASGNKGDKPIAPGVNLTDFSSRFEGEFVSPATGVIIFSINSDDGYAFYVDDKVISEGQKWTNGYVTCNVSVVKGQKYKLKLEQVQQLGYALIDLKANIME